MASYVIKGNFPRVRERLLKVPMTEVGISSVTEAELRFGVAKRPDAGKLKVAVEEFLIRVETLPWDSEAAKHYAAVRAALEKDGTPMGNMDMMIASQALAAEAMLITHDRCLGERGIEDWARH